MNSAIIIMTILGCSDGAAACDYIGTVETTFQSRAECQAHTAAELRHADLADYPSVVAVCEPLPEMTAGVAPPAAIGPEPVAEPQVIISQFDDVKRPSLLRRALDKTVGATRHVMTGVKTVFIVGWRTLTGKKRQESEPILLGRYMEADL